MVGFFQNDIDGRSKGVIALDPNEELPIALIKARISLGMSQKDLAKKIGTQEQQIQRYEANHYAAISFDRMMKIAEALGIALKNPIQIAIRDRADSLAGTV